MRLQLSELSCDRFLGATARRNKIHSVDCPVLNALQLAELGPSPTLLATEHPDVGVRSAGASIVSCRFNSSRAVLLGQGRRSATESQQRPCVQRWCWRAKCYPWQEERTVEMEMQAGPRRADAGTVCRQYDVGQTRVAIAGQMYRRSLEGWCGRRGGEGGGSGMLEPSTTMWRVSQGSGT